VKRRCLAKCIKSNCTTPSSKVLSSHPHAAVFGCRDRLLEATCLLQISCLSKKSEVSAGFHSRHFFIAQLKPSLLSECLESTREQKIATPRIRTRVGGFRSYRAGHSNRWTTCPSDHPLCLAFFPFTSSTFACSAAAFLPQITCHF